MVAPAVRVPSDEKVRVVAPPLATVTILATPLVAVSAPKVSVVMAFRKPLNSKVPPAVWVTLSALKTTVLPAAEAITSEAAAVARSLSVPPWIVVAPA